MHTISSISNGKEVIVNKALVKTVFVASFIIMTALGAYVRIPLPFTPVPITLQTFFVLLCGAMLGRKLGVFAQLSYVALGAFGAPLFQGYGAGLSHLLGPTGGYLIGFIAASFLVGTLLENKPGSSRFFRILFAMSCGLFAIYACGIAWLKMGYGVSFTKAVHIGFMPFVPGAVIKLIAASWVYSKIKARTDILIRG